MSTEEFQPAPIDIAATGTELLFFLAGSLLLPPLAPPPLAHAFRQLHGEEAIWPNMWQSCASSFPSLYFLGDVGVVFVPGSE